MSLHIEVMTSGEYRNPPSTGLTSTLMDPHWLVAGCTELIIPTDGVRPPVEREEHSSTREAPEERAVLAQREVSTQASSSRAFEAELGVVGRGVVGQDFEGDIA
jgi:hypothetical protein